MPASGRRNDKNRMADELFKLVEAEAGYAHISDGIDVLTEEQILELAASVQKRHETCVKLLGDFLYHHSVRRVLKRPYSPMKRREQQTPDITVRCRCGWGGKQSELCMDCCPSCMAEFEKVPH